MNQMKKANRFVAVALLLFTGAVFIISCKKSETGDNTQPDTFPTPIRSFISQGMVDSLRNAGGTIYSGTTPPLVNGIYYMHPDSCTFDNSPGGFTGTLFADYKFRFFNQDNTAFTLNVDQKNTSSGALSPTPATVYISGSGNNFSVFVLRTITPGGISVEQYNVLSGTLTPTGVQNFQNVLYVRKKGSDPTGSYPAAGTIRVFVTGAPGLATTSTTF